MKMNEISNVVRHPAMKRKEDFDNLLMSDNQDDIIAFIMDDNNTQERRLALLKRLYLMLGQAVDGYIYDESDLDSFMHASGEISPAEADEIARDLKLPPYHLSAVDETQDEDIPTGEYDLCDKCFGEGCPECEEGLIDVTGEFKLPNFDDFK
ncbi:MAG: hypothetical protein ACTSPB_24835 [Candidatus Thorarchaeota archaeon]